MGNLDLFHDFAISALNVISHDLPEKGLVAHALTASMPWLDEFAAYKDAKNIPIYEGDGGWRSLNWIKNEVVGSKVVVDSSAYADKLYSFGGGRYLGILSVGVLLYEDFVQTHVPFALAETKGAAVALVCEYYDKHREFAIKNAILDQDGDVIRNFRRMKWDDIVLPDGMCERIRDEIAVFFDSKAAYEERGLEWRRGMLLAGAPGNGKTSICRAIATSTNASVVYCEEEDNPKELVNSLKRTIGKNSPCVVIIEDADFVSESAMARQALLNMMDGVASTNGVFFVASTNTPEKLDVAFKDRPSRFDSYYVIKNPGPSERRHLLAAKLRELHLMPAAKVTKLVGRMDGMTAAAVQEVATLSLLRSIKSGHKITVQSLEESLDVMLQHSSDAAGGSGKWAGTMGFGG